MKVQKNMYSVLLIALTMSFAACSSTPEPVKEKPVQPKPQPVAQPQKPKPVKKVLKNSYIFHFKANSVQMESADKEALASIIEDFKKADSSVEFVIEGHAANVQLPKGEKKLSVQRVQLIANELKKNGIAADRIKTTAYSSTRPVAPNNTKKNRAKNRRVEIIIVNQ